MLRNMILGIAASVALVAGSTTALAQGTAITYQGQLKVSGAPVNSATDMQFSLWTAASGGTQVGTTITSLNVSVTNGLFTTPIDFGVNPYTSSQNLFLQIAVRNPAGGGAYVPMGSRQLLTPSPFSLATRGINVDGAGKVGIGTQPFNALHVLTAGNISIGLERIGGEKAELAVAASPGQFSASAQTNELVMRSRDGNKIHLQAGAGAAALTIATNNKVGIGTTTPYNILDVADGGIIGSSRLVGTSAADDAGNRGVKVGFGWAYADECGPSFNGMRVEVVPTTGPCSTLRNSTDLSFWTANCGTSCPRETMRLNGLGNLGIGTNAPATRLHVKSGRLRVDQSDGIGGSAVLELTNGTSTNVVYTAQGSGDLILSADAGKKIVSTSAFGIGTSPDQTFSVNGNASKTGGGSWATLSDERSKNDIEPMTGTLDRLLQLKGHSYSYKPEYVQNGRALSGIQIGLIAQEVETVFPDWVTTGPDGLKVVTERSTTALMVEAMRDLRNEKDAEIARVKSDNAELKARLEKIEAMLAAQASQTAK